MLGEVLCFGQHLLARRSIWKAELGTSEPTETLIICVKTDLIGDTSEKPQLHSSPSFPIKKGLQRCNINRMLTADLVQFPMETSVLPCCSDVPQAVMLVSRMTVLSDSSFPSALRTAQP